MKKIKYIASVSAGLLLLAPLTHAASLEDLEAQIEALRSQVVQMQSAANEQRIKDTQNEQRLASVSESEPKRKARPGFFSLAGTETDMRVYGSARAQIAYSIDSGFGHSQAVTGPFSSGYGGVAWNGSDQANRQGQVEFDARASRLGFETITATKYGDVRTLIETDFYGTGGSKLSTNAVSLRLRHAIVEVGPLMVGQYWSNSTDLGSSPWLLDLGGPVGLPAVSRVPQIRYTHKATDTQTVSVSFEQPVQDFKGVDGVSFIAGANNISKNSIDETLEFVSRYTYANDWMRQSLSAVARKLTYDTGASGERDSTYGYALTYQGKFNTIGRSNFYYSMTYADGANNYITQQNTSSAILEDGRLYRVKGKAFNVGYTQAWAPKWTSTFNVGANDFEIPKNTAAYGATMSSSSSFFASLMWNPIPKATLAMEYQYAKIKDDNGRKGDGQRLYLTSMYNF